MSAGLGLDAVVRPRARLLAVLAAAAIAAPAPADAGVRSGRAHHRVTAGASDSDRTLARMAGRDRVALWLAREESRPLGSHLPPVTRERVAAPPLTGWGYGGTIRGALPGF